MSEWSIPLTDVSLSDGDIAAVTEVLRSGWLTMGPRTESFESAFARYTGAPHAVAVSSGTAALHIACLAAGLGPDDEAIVPSLTFVASANAVAYTGARPVFADVTGLLDPVLSPERAGELIGPATRAIVLVHLAGFACDRSAFADLAVRHGLAIIEDAAHAAGTRLGGEHVGTWGTAGAFSFYSNKNLAVGEGGMLVTGDARVAERARLLRSHAMTRPTWDRHRRHASTYDVVAQGFNYRLDEARSALGESRLARLDGDNARRRTLVGRYRALLAGVATVEVPFAGRALEESAHHLVPVLVDADRRDAIREALAAEGIQTSQHYPLSHSFSTFASDRRGDLTVTDEYAARTLTLPLWADMSERQVETVVAALEVAAR